MNEWISVKDEMPRAGFKVLAFIPDYCASGNSRSTYALYAPPKTLEPSDDSEDVEYDEATDTFYCLEGWYEANEYAEVYWAITDRVTHWMKLPEAPEIKS